MGSAVVRLLVKSQKDNLPKFADDTPVRHVVALLRPGGSTERLEELRDYGNWSVEHADLTTRRELLDLIKRIHPRAILHVAVDRRIYGDLSESEKNRLNITPLETLFDGLTGVPGARVIHTGSAWVLPTGDRLGEGVTPKPGSAYGDSKLLADRSLPLLQEKTGVNWINLRLFNIFGKYEGRSRLLPYLVSRLMLGKPAELSSGNLVRDFTDVDDIARAFVLALQADEIACGSVYHIGSGRGMSLREFSLTVASVTGNGGLIRFGARESRDEYLSSQVADPALAKRVLNWSAAEDLEARICRTAKWWLEGWAAEGPPVDARSSGEPAIEYG